MSIKTITDPEAVKAANAARDGSAIEKVAKSAFNKKKKALSDHLFPDFDDSFDTEAEKLDIISNFKVATGKVTESVDEATGEVVTEIAEDGQIVQIQMRIQGTELTSAEVVDFKDVLGVKNYVKLFEEKKVFETIKDYAAFFGSISADVYRKAVQINKKGGIELKIAELPEKVAGVEGRIAVFPKAGFLDKVSALPKDIIDEALPKLKEFIDDRITPTVVIGNRPEEKKA